MSIRRQRERVQHLVGRVQAQTAEAAKHRAVIGRWRAHSLGGYRSLVLSFAAGACWAAARDRDDSNSALRQAAVGAADASRFAFRVYSTVERLRGSGA